VGLRGVAIVALLHDVVLTIGLFALLGLTVGMEADSLFVVALLTIIGFSVNDTVVIYDRIRENLRLVSRKVSLAEVVNLSLNQTFARSLNTTPDDDAAPSCHRHFRGSYLEGVCHCPAHWLYFGGVFQHFYRQPPVGVVAAAALWQKWRRCPCREGSRFTSL
jgi:hypothetical protein